MTSNPIDSLLITKQPKSATHTTLSTHLDEGLQDSDHSPSVFALALTQFSEQSNIKNDWTKITHRAHTGSPKHDIKNFTAVLDRSLDPNHQRMLDMSQAQTTSVHLGQDQKIKQNFHDPQRVLHAHRFSLGQKGNELHSQGSGQNPKPTLDAAPHVLDDKSFQHKYKPKHISADNVTHQEDHLRKNSNQPKKPINKSTSNNTPVAAELFARTEKNTPNTHLSVLTQTNGIDTHATVPSTQTPASTAQSTVSTQSPNLNHSMPVFEDKLDLHIQHPQWSQQLGKSLLRVASNASTGQSIAQIRLDPPHLGPLQVNLQLQEGQISAQFFSPHAYVRQSVEHALPQLSQQFEQAGLELGNTWVGDEQQTADEQYSAFKQALNQGQRQNNTSSTGATPSITQIETPSNAKRFYHPQSIINTFA